jgi:glycosyltransferase involved in cell wall biosynthesis
MSAAGSGQRVLMVAYTHYKTDPRVIREAEAAVRAGFAVDFLALRRSGEPEVEEVHGVHVLHLHQDRYRGANPLHYAIAYLAFFARCLVTAAVLHARHRYRVVHVNNMPDCLVFCALVPKLFGAKVILDIHDPMPNTFASKFRKGEAGLAFRLLLWQERLSAAFADLVLTVHEPLKRYVLVAQHGLPAASVQVVANFADDELFRPPPAPPTDGPLRLVFHGTILERYGLREAMIALSRMRRQDGIRVRIIGEGDFSATLATLIESLGLRDVVQFEPRMYPLHALPELLSHEHVGLVPLEISSITRYALPLKLLEYLSLGMPAITVRNVAISHYFGDDDCFFYEPGDADSLARLLDQLVESPDLVQHYRRRALVLRGKFSWSRERDRYVAMLRRLANADATAVPIEPEEPDRAVH